MTIDNFIDSAVTIAAFYVFLQSSIINKGIFFSYSMFLFGAFIFFFSHHFETPIAPFTLIVSGTLLAFFMKITNAVAFSQHKKDSYKKISLSCFLSFLSLSLFGTFALFLNAMLNYTFLSMTVCCLFSSIYFFILQKKEHKAVIVKCFS